LLVHELEKESSGVEGTSGYLSVVNNLVPSEGGSREALTHESNIGKVGKLIDEVGLVDLKLPDGVLGRIAIKFLDVRFGDFGFEQQEKRKV